MRNANFIRAILIGLPFGGGCVCVPVPTAHLLLHAEFLFLRCEIDEFKQVTHEKAKKKTYKAMHKLNFRFLLCFVRFDLNQIAHNQIS